MLRGAALILQLTLWIVTVHAFFPFIPDDQCDPGEHCGPFSSDSKRSHDGSAQISEGVTLDLVSLPRSVRVTPPEPASPSQPRNKMLTSLI
jgi:hypothetical protein